jgi:hypothetical protein
LQDNGDGPRKQWPSEALSKYYFAIRGYFQHNLFFCRKNNHRRCFALLKLGDIRQLYFTLKAVFKVLRRSLREAKMFSQILF